MGARTIPRVAVILTVMLAPMASADSTDYVEARDPIEGAVEALVNRTVEYVENFDPNDNATTLITKSQGFVEDTLVILTDLVETAVCDDFNLGIDIGNLGVKPKLQDGVILIGLPLYYQEDGVWGPGVLTITIAIFGSCGSVAPSIDDFVRSPIVDAVVEELLSKGKWLEFR